MKLAAPNYEKVVAREEVAEGCKYDVKTGTDGALYFSDESRVYRLGP